MLFVEPFLNPSDELLRIFQTEYNITELFDRIFHMLADINSVVIFSLLPANTIFMSASMYEVEMVRLYQAIKEFSK